MSTTLQIFTLFHVLISLVGIASGFVVAYGLLTSNRLENWTSLFLTTTVATSVTGYFFPVHRLMPSHVVGAISLVVLAVALFSLYRKHLDGPWRWIYVVTAMLAQYLNVFVLVAQSFLKVPALHDLAPTQTELPFKVAQLTLLVLFMILIVTAAIRFRGQAPSLAGAPLQAA